MTNNSFDKRKKIEDARSYLLADKHGDLADSSFPAIEKLAKEHYDHSSFTYARRLYQLLYKKYKQLNQPLQDDLIKKLAVSTYKDMDLSSEDKFDEAAQLLLSHFGDGDDVGNTNVLGILGAIFKKKWKYDNQVGHLYQSFRYYLKGYNLAKNEAEPDLSDVGYCGINVAFLYDLLARLGNFSEKTKAATDDPFTGMFKEYGKAANEIRKELCAAYEADIAKKEAIWQVDPGKKAAFDTYQRYWYYVTWAEALIGLGDFESAGKLMAQALEFVEVSKWKRDASLAQCTELVELLYGSDEATLPKAKTALQRLLTEGEKLPSSGVKIGLALSGGGFRASLFHIGVLAKLAEADLLRKVEVISCVSGGSILGAYYYLMLKKKVAEKEKDQLTKQDFIDLVAELETKFLDSIKNNVRIQILSNIWSGLKMTFNAQYTRSSRTAELYDKFLYNDLNGGKQVFINDLMIKPKGLDYFNPIQENWKMDSKVPILILNATTLNTGHAWQFTASFMGESPAYIGTEFDALPNLRRMYYKDDAPEGFKRIPLSTAVAASAGVPGLFAPIEFNGLYQEEEKEEIGESTPAAGATTKNKPLKDVKVLLVDGGVHDNQGISALYEQECNTLIISDASGQMPVDMRPPDSEIGVFQRTNAILQERIRNIQFIDLEARRKSGVVRDYILMHLTKGLYGGVVDWKDCKDPYIPLISRERQNERLANLEYGMKAKIQSLLARIRTDLDAFHDSEAYSLMYSGYLMTGHELGNAANRMNGMAKQDGSKNPWKFLKIGEIQGDHALSGNLAKRLEPSANLMGKALQLSKNIRILLMALLAIAALAGFGFIVKRLFDTIPPIWLAAVVGGALVTIGLERLLSKWLKVKSLAVCLVIWMPVIVVLGIVSYLLKWLATKWYLSAGALPTK